MASLEQDVLFTIFGELDDLRDTLIKDSPRLTPTQLIEAAIMRTADVIEGCFELKAIGVCESNGDPHWCKGIAVECNRYWSEVST
jgi:hypothetical protein